MLGMNGRRRLQQSGTQNRRGLNENYGRELMELHTIGLHYTQKDVTEVARCFTGWTIQRPRLGGAFYFNPRLHDYGQKTVLGHTIPAGQGIEDGLEVLHILAMSPYTAQRGFKKDSDLAGILFSRRLRGESEISVRIRGECTSRSRRSDRWRQATAGLYGADGRAGVPVRGALRL
jgi:Protein of unknown function (DUF1800)